MSVFKVRSRQSYGWINTWQLHKSLHAFMVYLSAHLKSRSLCCPYRGGGAYLNEMSMLMNDSEE